MLTSCSSALQKIEEKQGETEKNIEKHKNELKIILKKVEALGSSLMADTPITNSKRSTPEAIFINPVLEKTSELEEKVEKLQIFFESELKISKNMQTTELIN